MGKESKQAGYPVLDTLLVFWITRPLVGEHFELPCCQPGIACRQTQHCAQINQAAIRLDLELSDTVSAAQQCVQVMTVVVHGCINRRSAVARNACTSIRCKQAEVASTVYAEA